MICLSLDAPTNDALFRQLALASSEPCDVHGLRLGTMTEPPEAERLVAASSRPVMVGCLSREAGGAFDGPATERREPLLRAARAGAAYVCAEAADVQHLAGRTEGALLVAFFADRVGTPDGLSRVLANLAALPCDWVGFTVTHRRMADNVRVLDAFSACGKPCFGVATGDGGLVTRVLGLACGSRLAAGRLDPGHETPLADPTVRDLDRLYRVKELTRDTPVYGLLGNRVAHSRTFRLHNRAFAKLGFDAVSIPFRSESAEDFLPTIPGAINLRGFAVTTPHKPAALAWAESANGFARRIGAANILTLREGGSWHAENTDCTDAFESIQEAVSAAGLNLTGKPALVLGSRGTARAVGVALTLLGCRVTLCDRDGERAWRSAEEMGWEAEDWDEAPLMNWDVVANATPTGLYPDVEDTPFPPDRWREGMIAFDAVHNPQATRFLRDAAGAGCLTIDGMGMYLRNMEKQFLLWTGEVMPPLGF